MKAVTLSSDDLDEAVKAVLHGLISPAPQDKQAALEKALRAICTDDWVENAHAEFNWPRELTA